MEIKYVISNQMTYDILNFFIGLSGKKDEYFLDELTAQLT